MDTSTPQDHLWMMRCFDLARRGIGQVSPNPPVGAVLVYEGKLLSEGYHAFYGGPHAEVMAVRNVPAEQKHLIPDATLYVSLEPCCITSKTPPCTDLIVQEGIKDVRISTRDPNPAMAGKGLEILRSKGIRVTECVLEQDGQSLIRSFATNILKNRPHILLKWAQSKWGYTGVQGRQVWISDPQAKVWSHSQRAHVDAIVVGARTIETDDPSLTTREFPGRSPHRVILDPNARLEGHYNVFKQDGSKVFYLSNKENTRINGEHIITHVYPPSEDYVNHLLQFLFSHRIGNLLIEGGAYTQKEFIKANLWDEAWVIRTQHSLEEGIIAPNVRGRLLETFRVGTDTVVGIERMTSV
jgi:diaminohydroxyphosphoribosylaminopyrimidine deaminase/5-amino-6-(5-phosphoribosylamino)uracil reductase